MAHGRLIFYMIDGLACCEPRDEALFLVREIHQLVCEAGPHASLKILFTGAIPIEVLGAIPGQHLLLVPVAVDGDGQGFSISQVNRLLQRDEHH